MSDAISTEPETIDSTTGREVREQLERILSSKYFSNSQRYPAFLNYVVEATLRGEGSALRERIIGNAIFQRRADYDTNADPVVRITAAEVRKRLAQYYQEPAHAHELRIELRSGTYMPEFVSGSVKPDAKSPLTISTESKTVSARELLPPPPAERDERFKALRRRWITITLLAVAVIAAAAITWWRQNQPSRELQALRDVWAPIGGSGGHVLICIGVPEAVVRSAKDESKTLLDWTVHSDAVAFNDVLAEDRIVRTLQQLRTDYSLSTSEQVSFTRLREGPVVLIGALSNRWSIKAMQRLRYHPVVLPGNPYVYELSDAKNPSAHSWSIDFHEAVDSVAKDYGILARFVDPDTGQTTWLIGGLGSSGTMAAGEFATNPDELREMIDAAPKGWQTKNFEVVIESDVVRGVAGKPKLVAKEFW
jgi:hypothetical protein